MEFAKQIVILAAEGILLGVKLLSAYRQIKDKNTELRHFFRDKKLYLAGMVCFLLLTSIFLITQKQLVILQFLDMFMTYVILSGIDMKTHRIPDVFLLYLGASQLLYSLETVPILSLIRGVLAGAAVCTALLLLSLLCKGNLGLGDAKLLGVTVVFTGLSYLAQIVFWGLCAAFLYSVFLLAHKKGTRKTEIPFVPFLTGGMVLHILVWIF